MQDTHALTGWGERLSARALYRRLIAICVVAATMAAVLGSVLFLFRLDLTARQILLLVVIVVIACVPMFLCNILVINVHFRPIGAFLRALPGRPARPSPPRRCASASGLAAAR